MTTPTSLLDTSFEITHTEFEKTESNSCCSRIKNCFSSALNYLNSTWAGAIYRKVIPYQNLIGNFWRLVTNAANIRAFTGVINFFDHASSAAGQPSGSLAFFKKAIQIAKIFAVVSIPFALYYIGYEVREFFLGRDCFGSFFRTIESVAWLSESLAIFTTGLGAFLSAAQNLMQWAFSFYIANTFLSLSTTILNIRALIDSATFEKELDQAGARSFVHIKGKTSEQFTRILEVKGSRLKPMLNDNLNPEKATAAFRERIRTKSWGNKLAILSSLINVIGMVLLLFTPMFPLAYGLMAMASAIAILKFFYNRRAVAHFETDLKLAELPTE